MTTNFRKKPVIIEARQLHMTSFHDILRWIGEGVHPAAQAPALPHGVGCIAIRTLEGEMIASPGDWIIKGVKGEFYPCKPDIFAATYEPVEG